ncbi:MAG: polysaccharide biosynthesis tyrosine autokinase [Desulforegulaceae bacterium]|nr:polysaccharide biosynthesis tyrosine autokinase [Desulforegulaceae bacterium]
MGKIHKALEKIKANKDDIIDRNQNPDKKDFDSGLAVEGIEDIEEIEEIEENIPEEKESEKVFSRIDNVAEILVTVNKPHSVESEQFRLLKNSILFPDSGKPPKTIMVTSSDKGEGKSFVASNLAVSIAASIDEYVLLLDSDLRDPSVHNIFGIENSKGLSSYLSGESDLPSVFVKTFLKKLTLVPAGPSPLNPSELISSEQMKRLIDELRSRYDDRYIIIDSPPPYMTSEANALATYVDGVIIVVKQGHTKKERLKDILDIYGKDKILGVVKNFATGMFGSGYGYDKRYNYGKNKKK